MSQRLLERKMGMLDRKVRMANSGLIETGGGCADDVGHFVMIELYCFF
jgi:hypothetical protein